LHETARVSNRKQGAIPVGTSLCFIQKCQDFSNSRKSRLRMPRHVFRAMSRKGIFRRVMSSRDVAIRGAAPEISFDILTLGVPANTAGLRHDHRSSFLALFKGFVHRPQNRRCFGLRTYPAQQPESGRGGLGRSRRKYRNSVCARCASATFPCTRSARILDTKLGRGARSWRQRQTVILLTRRTRAASLPKQTLKRRSCRPPGRRRSKRDRVTRSKLDRIVQP
jgi:hypothetical protein